MQALNISMDSLKNDNLSDGFPFVGNYSDVGITEPNDMPVNLTNLPLDIRKYIYPIMMPVILVFCMASMLFSATITCCTPFLKRPVSPTIRLSLSLSAANTAFASVVFVGTVIHSYLPSVFEIHFPMCLRLAVEVLRLGVILVQVYHLLAVALSHYLGTLRPLLYSSLLTSKNTNLLIVCLWIVPIAGLFIGFSSVPDQGFLSEQCLNNHFRNDGLTFRLLWAVLFFGPTVILLVVYFHIFQILSRRGNAMTINSINRRNIIRNMKTIKTTALIVLTFVIGWCPAVFAFMLICNECPIQINDMRISVAIFSSCYILFILKVFADTFIYALRLPEIREALWLLYVYIIMKCKPSAAISRRGLVNTTRRQYTSRSTFSSQSTSTKHANKSSRITEISKMSSNRSISETKPLVENRAPNASIKGNIPSLKKTQEN